MQAGNAGTCRQPELALHAGRSRGNNEYEFQRSRKKEGPKAEKHGSWVDETGPRAAKR